MTKNTMDIHSEEFKKLSYKEQLIILDEMKRELDERIEEYDETIKKILKKWINLSKNKAKGY